ncbi:MAG: glycosyltransferase family 2 protein [Actinomycetota bacterium]
MYRGLSVIAMVPVLNEQEKIGDVVRRTPRDTADEILVIDDGSTDRSAEVARELGANVLPMGRTVGVGAALRAGYRYAVEKGYDVAVVMAGNNKDSPEELPILLEPIANGRADFVQGSRFLKQRPDFGPMPAYRKVATRLHPMLFSLVAGKKVTDSSNGFRAVRTEVLRDRRLDLDQEWLDQYELEPYLYLKAIRLGYRVIEVPVTKVYPPKAMGQTKMKPVVGWWSMLRPLFYMGLRIKK